FDYPEESSMHRTSSESSLPPPPSEHPVLGLLSAVGGFVIFFVAAVLAVTSITEFAVREQVLALLRNEQEKVRGRLFRQTVTSATFKANQILVDGSQRILKDKAEAASILENVVKLQAQSTEAARRAVGLAREAGDILRGSGLSLDLIGPLDEEQSFPRA